MKTETKVPLLIIAWIVGTAAVTSFFDKFVDKPVLDWIAIVAVIVIGSLCFWLYRVL